MADTKISGFAADAAPNRAADYAVTYDASATGNKRVSLNNFGVIPIVTGFGTTGPTDGATYYMGAWPELAATTNADGRRIYIQRAGTITRAALFFNGTAGTAENSTFSIRLNNTTDYAISSTVAFNALPLYVAVTTLTVAVAVGDYIEIKWACPTWVTNPSLLGRISLILE